MLESISSTIPLGGRHPWHRLACLLVKTLAISGIVVDDRDALASEPVSDDGHLSEPEFRAFLAPRQMAVVATVQEINAEADHQPNDKPQPSIARQAEH